MHTTHMFNNEDYRLIIESLCTRQANIEYFNDEYRVKTKFMRNKYFSRKIDE